MSYTSGFGGEALIGTHELPITEWGVNETSRIAKTDNSKTNNFMLSDPSGGIEAAITINIDFDLADNPMQTPYGIKRGVKLSNLLLYLKGKVSGSLLFTFPSATVQSTSVRAVRGSTTMMQLVATLTSDGEYYVPGDTVPA